MEEEVTRIDKKGSELTKMISYRLQFIDSTRFMALWQVHYQILLIILLKEFIK